MFLFVEDKTLWPLTDCKSFQESISKIGSVADKRLQVAVVKDLMRVHKSNAIEKSFGCFCDIQYFERKTGDKTNNIYYCFLISGKIVRGHIIDSEGIHRSLGTSYNF